MILWRRIAQDTGGAGVTRGGLGVDTAMAILHCDRMNGGAYTNTALIPPRGAVGGFPGAAGAWKVWRKTNLIEMLEGNVFPDVDKITGEVPQGTATVTDFQINRGDIYDVIHGGGGGLGDPLRRTPVLVATDVANGFVSIDVAREVYGVVLGADGEVDAGATETARHAIRVSRIGHEPARTVAADAPMFAPLRSTSGVWNCTQCSESLGSVEGNWREAAVTTEGTVSSRFAELHSQVRARNGGEPVVMREHYCPGCASSLGIDIAVEGAAPLPGMRLGVIDPFPADLVLGS